MGEITYEFQVFVQDELYASGECASLERAKQEAAHYAAGLPPTDEEAEVVIYKKERVYVDLP